MAQFLRPDSNVTQTNTSGGFADIDEASASDTDRARSLGLSNAETARFEAGLSNPGGTPGSGTSTVRYRGAKLTSAGSALSSDGRTVTLTVHIYQGTTLIASDTARTLGGAWTAYSFTPNLSGVTDWNDLRIRCDWSGSGGGGSTNDRCGAVSWAELEAPDAPAPITGSMAAAETGSDVAAGSGSVLASGALAVAETGDDVFAASGTVADPEPITGTLAATEVGSDSFAGSGGVVITGAFATVEAANDNANMAGAIAVNGALALAESGIDAFSGQGTASGGAASTLICRRHMRLGLRR